MPSIRSLVLVLGMFTAFTTVALAQNWPTRRVKIVVPSSPGGGTDTFARLISPRLADALKQPFVVDKRPGAGGNIGAHVGAEAAPEGHPVLVASMQDVVVNP